MLVRERQTSIGKLRFAASDRDRITARLELERLLASADLHPVGLPAPAIFCVNKVSARQPVRSDRFSADTAWQEALRASLSDLATRAERLSPKNPSARGDAIVFDSWAELMACLARDWSAGTIIDRWWWRAILRSDQSFWTIWRDHPEYIPAALEHLARARLVVEVVAKFTAVEARELTSFVVNSFGLSAIANTAEFHAPEISEFSATASTAAWDATRDGSRFESQALSQPWLRYVPEAAAPQLSREQQTFLGISLMIQRAPSVVRTPKFAREVEHWRAHFATQSREFAESVSSVTTLSTEAGPDTKTVDVNSSLAESIGGLPTSFEARSEPRIEHDSKTIADVILPASSRESIQQTIGTDAINERPNLSVPNAEQSTVGKIESSPSPTSELLPAPPTEPALHDDAPFERVDYDTETTAVWIETNLGGLLYLVNLALYLDLYGDFTSPTACGIDLNIWDFAALIGAELIGEAHDADPIWDWLAKMAGREAEQPGDSFDPENEWRMPAEWLAPFANEQPWKWNVSRGRLRVWHPEGFAILDLPRAKDVRAQLRREIKVYGVRMQVLSRARLPRVIPLRSKRTRRRSVRRWLSLLMPYVCARLRVALGVEARDVAATLCRQHAKICATDTHVDVYFGLADLPLAIRFAGLDRDPGWVPVAGRFITFHFE